MARTNLETEDVTEEELCVEDPTFPPLDAIWALLQPMSHQLNLH